MPADERWTDLAEGDEFAGYRIERRLGRNADKELRAVAIGFIRNTERGNHAAVMLHVAEFGRQQAKTAGAE